MIKQTNDFSQISNLWQICFGDTTDYIKFFFENCKKKSCLGFFKDDVLVSMFYLIDCSIGEYKGEYIFAACTHPDFRSQGLMGELIEYQKSHSKKDFSCLVPAEKSLFDYYSRFGFKTKLYSGVEKNLCDDLKNCSQLSFNEFMKLRKSVTSNFSVLNWDDLEFFYNENIFCGGYFLNNNECLVSVRDNKIVENIDSIFSFDNPKGMIYSKFNIPNSYIGLVLD